MYVCIYICLSRSMLGRGVKRKHSCSEELEAEARQANPSKEEEDGVEPGMSHLQQRQLVLTMCLDKLQRYQTGMELGLRRSVLLINTLKQIQEDMRRDGAGSAFAGGTDRSAQILPSALVCTSDASTGPALDAPFSGIGPDRMLFREDVPLTCPGCAGEEMQGLLLLSPPLSSPSVCPSHDSGSSASPRSLPSTPYPPFTDTVNSALGYLGDLALDDIFEDIDTSMYETSELPSACLVAGSLWPISQSFWGDEDPKMCSAGHTQSCLTDLNELDHIMEILVKS